MPLVDQLKVAMKNAMRAKDKSRLGVIRMALAAVKQGEIDINLEATDDNVIAILTKMVKQRKESIKMFSQGGRMELAAKEAAEVEAIESFLPKPLTTEQISQHITDAISQSQATSMADMGKVMAVLKPLLQGKADLGQVSGQVRLALTN